MTSIQSESDTLIKNILPLLENLGWERERMDFEKTCEAGQIDLLYNDKNGKPIIVLEAKRPKKPIKNVLETQAIPYAKAIKAPIAIVWDGVGQLETYHIKKKCPLFDYDDEQIKHSTISLLHENNLKFFCKNPSLNVKIKNSIEIEKIFKKLNLIGKNIGLTVGVERVTEIAKILFIKMLCDNETYLSRQEWDMLRTSGLEKIVQSINYIISRNLKESGISIPELIIPVGKGREVWDIIELLETINFDNRYYGDVTGSLFEHFLSSRARAGGTNDLGQYFTPKKIDELIYQLSDYDESKTVYDPFCGTGGILLEFFRQQEILGLKDKKEFAKRYLYGSELSQPVSQLAKMNMVIFGDGHTNIQGYDSLSRNNPYMKQKKQFDIVATNMPFVPSVPNDVPNDCFLMSYDQNDVCKFIEHTINSCKIGGKVILIVGKGFLTENASIKFRRRLLENHCLEAVYTLYGGVFYPYTQAFSTMLIISKGKLAQKEFVDFFHIENDDDINTAKKFYKDDSRYQHDYYRIKVSDIKKDGACDFRGAIYKTDSTEARVRDIAHLVDKKKTNMPMGRKLTTPNSIKDGLYLIDTQSNKRVESGEDSFCYKVEKGAIIISRIVGNRKLGRYLGSAIAGNNYNNLITAEYHQIIPKNPEDVYFMLNWFRSKSFQRIIQLAKGTGGQQRIEDKFIMNAPIPVPNDELRKQAFNNLMDIETNRFADIADKMNKNERDEIILRLYEKYQPIEKNDAK